MALIKTAINADKRSFIKELNYDSLMTFTFKFMILSSHSNGLIYF